MLFASAFKISLDFNEVRPSGPKFWCLPSAREFSVSNSLHLSLSLWLFSYWFIVRLGSLRAGFTLMFLFPDWVTVSNPSLSSLALPLLGRVYCGSSCALPSSVILLSSALEFGCGFCLSVTCSSLSSCNCKVLSIVPSASIKQ